MQCDRFDFATQPMDLRIPGDSGAPDPFGGDLDRNQHLLFQVKAHQPMFHPIEKDPFRIGFCWFPDMIDDQVGGLFEHLCC
jgi:hypothetical protein